MSNKYPGIHLNGNGLQIDFRYKGVRCKEHWDIKPTDSNLKAASKRRQRILDEIRLGTFNYAEEFPHSKRATQFGDVRKNTLTFAECAEKWISNQSHLAKSTLASYKSALDSMWLPAVGEILIRDIKPSDLQSAVKQLGVGKKTTNNYLTPCRKVFRLALDEGYIDKDPSARLENRRVQKPEPDPLDLDEVGAVLNYMKAHCPEQVLNYFQIAFFTGLRTSELIALTWDDVDLDKRKLRVNKAKVKGEVKGTKTNSVRYVDLNTRAVEALDRQKKITLGVGEVVFRNPKTGQPWANDKYQRKTYWHPTLAALNMRPRDAYQTRHTFATWMLMNGVAPAYIANQMGHANMGMLLQRYGRWLPTGNAFEAAKVETVLGSANLPSGPNRVLT
jgi:integrase